MIRKALIGAVAMVLLLAAPAAAQYAGPDDTTPPPANGDVGDIDDGPGDGVPPGDDGVDDGPGDGVPPGDDGVDDGPGDGVADDGDGIASGELPRTGSSDTIRLIALAGAILLTAGGLFLVNARRRASA